MASLIYGSTHESSSKLHAKGLYYTWNQDMDYLLCVSVCASSNYFLLLMTCHTLNKQMLSPVWFISCFFKCLCSIKHLSHLELENGSPHLWVQSCIFKLAWCLQALQALQALSHLEPACGFFPVWVSSCFFKWSLFANVKRHNKTKASLVIKSIWDVLSVRMPCHILSRHTAFHQCGFSHVFSKES